MNDERPWLNINKPAALSGRHPSLTRMRRAIAGSRHPARDGIHTAAAGGGEVRESAAGR
jgi:hypothetical protein